MPIYQYTVITKQGKKKKGQLDANNKESVYATLKENGHYPVEVTELSILQKDIDIYIGNPVKIKDLAIFCRQFSSILSAGVSVLAALNIIRQQTENKVLTKKLNEVYHTVESGEALADSMVQHEKTFPAILINMVRAGEVSGNLETSFERMAIHFEKEFKLQQSVQKAVTYPIIVAIMAIIVVGILVTVVVPTFVGMFTDIGMELPVSTKALLAISDFVRNKWYILILIIILVIFLLTYYLRSEVGKLMFSGLKLKLPLFGKLNVKVAASRFTRTLSTLLASGLPLITALEVVAKVIDNHVVEKGILGAKEQVSRGVELSIPIEDMGIFPPMVTHMVKIGEETGTLESTLNKVADFYDDEVETAVTQLTTLLEPLIIVVMAVVVGFVVISIVQPMFQMYQGIGNL